MERFLLNETIIVALLLIGTFVAMALQHVNFPYLVAIVLVGLAMMMPRSSEIDLRPELLLALFIPPLLFGTARQIDLGALRGNLIRVLVLALPGIVLITLIVGGMLTLFTPLALPTAFVFGALISTTDPFALGALLRNSGVSDRLASLINSESLLNNVTAIVVFNLAIATVLTGQFHFLNSLGEFIRVLVGGVAVGLICGWSISKLVAWGNDNLMETALTTLLPFVSYLLAERLQLSGALAVIVAGLVNGNISPQGTISRPWEFLAFVANSLIFLLMGLEFRLPALLGAWQPVLWGIITIILARALVVYGLNGLVRHNADGLPMNWLHIWNWGGLHGAIGMLLALSLPREFGESRDLMTFMVFGVVLFSVLIQSTTLKALLHWLGPVTNLEEQLEE